MCGIVGIFSNKKNLSSKIVETMNEVQSHRGPDGEGTWSSQNKNVHFGHRRLSIIDLSNAGSQPMHSSDGRYIITYNGEIYNFTELKEKCIAKGSKFHSKTDTEVIIEYIRHFGKEGIKDFRGMWAFAIYDTKDNTILLSRDPFGIKPLFYGIKDGVFYFASEIKSLSMIDPYFNIIDEVTEKIFIEYAALDIGEWTFFKNIKRFMPAHYAEINLNKDIELKSEIYWKPPKQQEVTSEKETIAKLKSLLEQSIKRHLVTDVGLAFCLSGGLDSSTIVGIANKFSPKNQKLKTFTTHYPEFPEIDETKWAKFAIDYCNTDYEFVEPTFKEFKEDFYKVIHHHDEPFGSTSVYAQNAIFKAINSAKIKVSLDGQGADEVFAGYHSYFPILLLTLLKKGNLLTFMVESVSLMLAQPRLFLGYIPKLGRSFVRKKFLLLYKKINSFIKPNSNEIDKSVQERLNYLSKTYNSDFHQNLIDKLTSTSIPQLLRNGDRNSMTHSVESRVPFLDVDLVNFVISLPNNYKIRRAVTKYILRKVSTDYLPNELVYRKDKMGFPSPEKEWLKKAFDIDTSGIFTKTFRKFIVEKWRKVINERSI